MWGGHGCVHANTGEGRGVGSPGAAVTDGCEPPLTALCWCWELNPGPQQKL